MGSAVEVGRGVVAGISFDDDEDAFWVFQGRNSGVWSGVLLCIFLAHDEKVSLVFNLF